MAYVDRDTAGNVVGIYANPQREGHEWVESAELWTSPAAVPQNVSRFQARAALYLAGLLDQVQALMDDPATSGLARLAWQDAQEFRRTSPTVVGMGLALGLTDVQLDQLFITAAGIEA